MVSINKNLKILVVDDEPSLRLLMNFHLKMRGFSVLAAEDAVSALTILEKQDVDLIISDIRMPGTMDGIDLVEAQRKKKPEQKVILMTGYTLDKRFERAQEVGVIHCLRKPFELMELETALSQLFV